MHTSRRRSLCLLVVSVTSAALLAAVAGTCLAATADDQAPGPGAAVEPGWPESHFPQNDPKPGEPGHADLLQPAGEPPEGMTDDEFRAHDPKGYATIVPERDKIERELLERVHQALRVRGLRTAAGATSPVDIARAVVALATTPYSPYGYLRFTLVPNTTSTYARNGYLGTTYFIYGYYSATTDSYKWYTVSWPARSGDNRPSHQSTADVGPIPAYTWDFGFMYGAWRGYEADTREAFYPGKWRLDPWTGGPYGRSYLEVHGGTGSSLFGPTNGCIRMYPAAVSALKTYYDTKMANKRDPSSAHVIVKY